MRTTVSVWLAYMNRGTSSSFPPSKVVIDAIELTWQSSTFLRHEEQCKRKEHVTVEELVQLASSSARMRRCGLTTALTNFVAYAPKSSCGEDVEAFYMDLRALAIPEALLSTLDMGSRYVSVELEEQQATKLCREAIKEDFKERRAEVLAEDAEAGKSIRSARQEFANRKTRMSALWNPYGIATASGKGMEKILSRGSPVRSTTCHQGPCETLHSLPAGTQGPQTLGDQRDRVAV
ncbi:hypothetical protein RB195_017738 [Necator americanus]|uniref:Uncharacterized protein n=1 Tax=Necator americanus TaxID=51031 RepID=A0ABR1C6J4_NECAM